MRRPIPNPHCRRASRAGFSLVEILVVVGILALLAGIVVTVVKGVVGGARERATKATIRKIDGLLMKRVAAFDRYCDGQDKLSAQASNVTTGVPPSYARPQLPRNWVNPPVARHVLQAYNCLMFGDPNASNTEVPPGAWATSTGSRPVLLLIARKSFFLQSFPQSLDDTKRDQNWNRVLNADQNTPPWDDEVSPIKFSGDSARSDLLYLMLTKFDSFGVEPDDLSEFKSNELVDVNGNGIPEFIDGWGNPIRFYRWPTRLVRPADVASYSLPSPPPQTLDGTNANLHLRNYHNPILSGLNYSLLSGSNVEGATLTTLIATLPVTSGTPTRGPGTTLEQEHGDPLAKDPSDIRHRLHPGETTMASVSGANWIVFIQWMERELHTIDTFHIPLLVSAGQDKELGLFEPTDTNRFGHLAQPDLESRGALLDNITNRNITAGGK